MGDAINIASAGFKVAGELSAGQGQKVASQVKAIQLQTAKKAAETRASQSNAAFTEELRNTLDAIGVIRAAQNVGDSPTGMALDARATELSDRARRSAISNEQLKALQLDGDARSLLIAGNQAMNAAYLRAASDGFQSVGSIDRQTGGNSSKALKALGFA